MMKWLSLLAVFAFPTLLCAQDGDASPEPGQSLLDVLQVKMRTNADVEERNDALRVWLEENSSKVAPTQQYLVDLARSHSGSDTEKTSALESLATYARRKPQPPQTEFDEMIGRQLMFFCCTLTETGKWLQAKKLLPGILRMQSDHLSTYWLLGRRGRDHGSDEGKTFLRSVIIPTVLADHLLDDSDRVYILRRLHEVEYTGPAPFNHLSGPGLDGKPISTTALKGSVSLVFYWATW